MLSPEENAYLTRIGPGHADGRACSAASGCPLFLSSELPENDGPPLRTRILNEDLVGYRDTNGHVGVARRVLSAPPRAAVLRTQRGVRSALRVPRLEVRRQRHVRRHAVRAARERLQGPAAHQGLSDLRSRRPGVDLHGAARQATRASAAAGVDRATRQSPAGRQVVPREQLHAGHRGRHRHRARRVSCTGQAPDRRSEQRGPRRARRQPVPRRRQASAPDGDGHRLRHGLRRPPPACPTAASTGASRSGCCRASR